MDANLELNLLSSEEKELLEYIWNLIPAQDKESLTKADVQLVLDLMDDYFEEKGLLEVDEQTGEVTYLDGEVDENDQLEYLLRTAKERYDRTLSGEQVQLVLDGEMQYGIEQGYYEEED